jgi:hypothetical protein
LTYNHSLGGVTVVENSLNDIVSVAVPKKFLQSRSVQDFSNKVLSDLRVGDSDTLLDDVRREPAISVYSSSVASEEGENILLNRKTADVSDKSPDQWLRESSIVQIENILNHVISERILNEVERVEDDLSDELKSLGGRCVIDGSL